MAKRRVEVFSLSFLDVICCGFGAVILFYTIISAQSGVERTRQAEDLAAQVSLLEEEVLRGAKNLVLLRNTLEKTESETVSAASRATQLIEALQRRREEAFIYDASTLAKRERIEQLKADVQALEESTRRLEASASVQTPSAERAGAGRSRASRRYITGLTLKGKRILVLLDRSSSMLDADLVNILRLRNMSASDQQSAVKWQRALQIGSWLINEIPDRAEFQIYVFNTDARALLPETAGDWLPAKDLALREKALTAIFDLKPEGGTSLINALQATKSLPMPPDQIVLITDGLPTQGATPPALRRFVDAGQRARLFDEAVRGLNRNIPIDVILLPMKGDVPAPHRFWSLARETRGAFVMPSPDWP
ncbi:MAG: VWA domain-containing protein [Steroidobacteraceae bacterium]